jgi:hypothetical protein
MILKTLFNSYLHLRLQKASPSLWYWTFESFAKYVSLEMDALNIENKIHVPICSSKKKRRREKGEGVEEKGSKNDGSESADTEHRF